MTYLQTVKNFGSSKRSFETFIYNNICFKLILIANNNLDKTVWILLAVSKQVYLINKLKPSPFNFLG